MILYNIDNVRFYLNEVRDLSWLSDFGRVFRVFSQNDSGNISFGLDNGREKYFLKIAGTKTTESIVTPQKAVDSLKNAMPLYEILKHPSLIRLVGHRQTNDLYLALFEWAEGECLFDHWNFEYYRQNPSIIPPAARFKALPAGKRLRAFDTIFSFLMHTADLNHVAVDFYDGSILYDFETDFTTICDIDFFRKAPAKNDMGVDFYGTKRLKSPEEYIFGAAIDEITNVFTLGALLFHYFGTYTSAETAFMYQSNAFFPCPPERWDLNPESYRIVLKATEKERNKRFRSLSEFYFAWRQALSAV